MRINIHETHQQQTNRRVSVLGPGMTARLYHLILLIVMLSMFDSPTAALGGSSRPTNNAERFTAELERFEDSRKKADLQMLRAFDRAIAAVKQTRTIAVGERARLIEEIEESKRRFESDGTLPASDSLVAFSVDYLDAVHQYVIERRLVLRVVAVHGNPAADLVSLWKK